MAFWNKQNAQQLENVEVTIVKEAEAVEIELKAMITEEAKNLQFAQQAWNQVRDMVARMRYVETELNIAKTHPTGATAQMALNNAKAKLGEIEKEWSGIEGDIKNAVKLETIEKGVASKAFNTLKDLHGKLKTEENRIRQAKGW